MSTYFAHENGKNIFKTVEHDVQPILDFNQRAAEKLDKKKDRWFVGTIPNSICMQWAKESNSRIFSREWHKYAMKQLNNPDYRKLNPNRIRLNDR